MKIERNVKGLQESAKRKREQALEKVEVGIKKLIKEQRPINFNTVAEASDVSKAWLYKQPEVRQRIEHLRSQVGSRQKTPPKNRASDESLKAIIQTLKARVKRLEEENRDLRQQNQVAYGQVLRVKELERQLARIEDENQKLKNEPRENRSEGIISQDILLRLRELGVEMNSTLRDLIDTTPEVIVSQAIESLREAIAKGNIGNPGGFLNKAIKEAWMPNDRDEPQSSKGIFKQWYDLAYAQRLVIGAQNIKGIQYVITPDGKHFLFDDMLRQKPIASLSGDQHDGH